MFHLQLASMDPLARLLFLLLDRGIQKNYFQDFLGLPCKDIVMSQVSQILSMLHQTHSLA